MTARMPGTFPSLTEYFGAVRRRVKSPAEGWPSHLELPTPDWRAIGKALTAASAYE
jgi:hypothetical protein